MNTGINTYILWNEDENTVIEIPNLATVKNHIILLNKYAFRPSENEHLFRFGKWTYYDELGKSCKNWEYIPKESMPKEFLTQILLLGYQI